MPDTEKRAARAKALLEDVTFKDALRVVKEYHTSVFLRPSATEDEVMEARRMVLALTEVANQLVSFVQDGEMIAAKGRN